MLTLEYMCQAEMNSKNLTLKIKYKKKIKITWLLLVQLLFYILIYLPTLISK
jgi:hypothetical protein